LLRTRAALISNTSNTPWEREVAVLGNPLERLWRDCVFGFGPMASSTPARREEWLAVVGNVVAKHV
jgi:hypothetical protein